MSTHFDAVIIGAGPAGATAAILLARNGWRVALVEKSVFPRRKVCGECIAASNLPLLQALGVGEAALGLAGPALRRMALMRGERTLYADLPRFADTRYPWGMALGREYLDPLLLEQAKLCGASLFQPWDARAVHGAAGDLSCDIAKLHSRETLTLTAPVMIAAYGSWELPPSGLQQQRAAPQAGDLFAFKANFSHASIEAGLLPVLSFTGGYGGMVLGDHATATIAFCIRRNTLSECRKALPHLKAAEAAARYVASACRGVVQALLGAEQQGPWLSVGPLRPGIRMPRQGGRCFLIGNAAGEAHPIVGEGISMAIQSAWLLAAELSGHRHDISSQHRQRQIQQQYAQAWRRHFAPRIHLASLFAHVAMRPALAGVALSWLERFPELLTQAARWSGKVSGAPAWTPPPISV